MKKFLCIVLSILMLFSMTACSDKNTEEATIENNEIDVETESSKTNIELGYHAFYYDTVKWNELPEKDVDFKMGGAVSAPFDLRQFKDAINSVSAPVYEEGYQYLGSDQYRESDFSLLTDGTRFMLPYFGTSTTMTIRLNLKNESNIDMLIMAAPENDNVPQNIIQAIEEGRHHYAPATDYNKEVFLDVDMEDLPVREGFLKSEGNLLKKAVEKFGRPTKVELVREHMDDDDSDGTLIGNKEYNIIYEHEDFVLAIYVYETQYIYSDGSTYDYVKVLPRVYGKEAWRLYNEYYKYKE